jgi:hypothetical protein
MKFFMGGIVLAFALLAIATDRIIDAQAAKIKELEADQLILRSQVEQYMKSQERTNAQHGQAISGLVLRANEEDNLEKTVKRYLNKAK